MVKVLNIELHFPGTRPFDILTSSNPDDAMNNKSEEREQATMQSNQLSCSNSPAPKTIPKGIMKSTPKLNKFVTKNLATTKPRTSHHSNA